MSFTFDIAQVDISSQLLGEISDAGLLDKRLRTMLVDDVLPRAAQELEELVGEEEIICLPVLPVQLQLTLEEVLSGVGTQNWSAALVEVLMARITEHEDIWRFNNRWEFLAIYLKTRLGMVQVPASVFSGLGTLDLLSPVQATVECLRNWPLIWGWLARGGEVAALAFIKALKAQGGEAILKQILLAVLSRSDEGSHNNSSSELIEAIQRVAVSKQLHWAWIAQEQANLNSFSQCALLATLAFTAEEETEAARLGIILALLINAQDSRKLPAYPNDVLGTLRKVAKGLTTTLRQKVLALIDVLENEKSSLTALAMLENSVVQSMKKMEAPVLVPKRDNAVKTEAVGDTDAATFDVGVDCQIYYSNLAGTALCLPFLTENRIGLSFPAHVRLAALTLLTGEVGENPAGHPEEDPLLMALCGQDEQDYIPDRPNAIDMLFVPQSRHAAIQEAPSGEKRLAAWIEARFSASLPGLGSSSLSFLRQQFLHTPGRLTLSEDRALLEVDSMPLRAVLELGGLVGSDRGCLDWLGSRQLVIRLREMEK